MSKNVWQKLGSPELKPPVITLRAYDDRPSTAVSLYQNVLVCLVGKTIHIDIEVLDAHLDYNILLGKNYMYAMPAITSSVFHIMMFPHEDRIITVDQLTHNKKRPLKNTNVILPYVDTVLDGLSRYQEYGPGQFKSLSILGSFLGDPPIIPESSPDVTGAPVCMMSTSSAEAS